LSVESAPSVGKPKSMTRELYNYIILK